MEELIAIKAGPERFQHVRKNLKMNPSSQTRLLLTYLILINASVILIVGLQLVMRIPASEQWWKKNSGTQCSRIDPESSINQSTYALQTELFRLTQVTGFNLHLYIVAVSISIRGCVIHIIIITIRQNTLALMKIGKIYVHIYLNAQIIYKKLWYMYETTSLRIEINVANVY